MIQGSISAVKEHWNMPGWLANDHKSIKMGENKMKRAYERLLDYVVVHTTSDEESETYRQSSKRIDLAKTLVQEMKEISIADAHVDDKCYLWYVGSNDGLQDKPVIGFIAHMDTARIFQGNMYIRFARKLRWKRCCVRASGRTLSVKIFHICRMRAENPDYNRWYDAFAVQMTKRESQR